jgi:hypothetical protein
MPGAYRSTATPLLGLWMTRNQNYISTHCGAPAASHVAGTREVYHVVTRTFRTFALSPPRSWLQLHVNSSYIFCLLPHYTHTLRRWHYHTMAPTLRNSTRQKTIASTKAATDAGHGRKQRGSLSRRQRYTHNKGLVSWKKSMDLDSM